MTMDKAMYGLDIFVRSMFNVTCVFLSTTYTVMYHGLIFIQGVNCNNMVSL